MAIMGAVKGGKVLFPPSRLMFFVVDHPKEACPFETKEAAEGAALLLVAKDPEAMLNKTSVREWDGKKRYP
jgi:hypothetical protein